MTDVRKFPPQDIRVECGPIQFGDDWPGLFLRGDTALWYAMQLGALLQREDLDAFVRIAILGLVEQLSSVNEWHHRLPGEPPPV